MSPYLAIKKLRNHHRSLLCLPKLVSYWHIATVCWSRPGNPRKNAERNQEGFLPSGWWVIIRWCWMWTSHRHAYSYLYMSHQNLFRLLHTQGSIKLCICLAITIFPSVSSRPCPVFQRLMEQSCKESLFISADEKVRFSHLQTNGFKLKLIAPDKTKVIHFP